MSKQPEALRLADECATGFPLAQDAGDAAAELRRQHALIVEMRNLLKHIDNCLFLTDEGRLGLSSGFEEARFDATLAKAEAQS